jgi:hypothetical protein
MKRLCVQTFLVNIVFLYTANKQLAERSAIGYTRPLLLRCRAFSSLPLRRHNFVFGWTKVYFEIGLGHIIIVYSRVIWKAYCAAMNWFLCCLVIWNVLTQSMLMTQFKVAGDGHYSVGRDDDVPNNLQQDRLLHPWVLLFSIFGYSSVAYYYPTFATFRVYSSVGVECFRV